MIEFKTKPFSPGNLVDDWAEVRTIGYRAIDDYEFSYCDYRIGGIIYRSKTEAFKAALKKEEFWHKLKR